MSSVVVVVAVVAVIAIVIVVIVVVVVMWLFWTNIDAERCVYPHDYTIYFELIPESSGLTSGITPTGTGRPNGRSPKTHRVLNSIRPRRHIAR